MRWREGDGGRGRAEIVSRKVGSQADSRRFKALFNVRPRHPELLLGLFRKVFTNLSK